MLREMSNIIIISIIIIATVPKAQFQYDELFLIINPESRLVFSSMS